MFRYKWQSDPFIRGAYSYLSVDSTPADIENVGEPIQPGDVSISLPEMISLPISTLGLHSFTKVPLVLFAGEATDVESFSTVLGAFLAGIRESSRVIKTFKISSDRPIAQQREE